MARINMKLRKFCMITKGYLRYRDVAASAILIELFDDGIIIYFNEYITGVQFNRNLWYNGWRGCKYGSLSIMNKDKIYKVASKSQARECFKINLGNNAHSYPKVDGRRPDIKKAKLFWDLSGSSFFCHKHIVGIQTSISNAPESFVVQ